MIYCVDNDNKDANEFRYTQDSRRKECKIKKYAKIILEFKNFFKFYLIDVFFSKKNYKQK